jgi:hypothetical protein
MLCAEPYTAARPGASHPSRDHYPPVLLTLALGLLLLDQVLDLRWLPQLFPAMGVLFAAGGLLMAQLLEEAPGDHWRVLGKVAYRLLAPLWLYGFVVVPAMLRAGWAGGSPFTWRNMLLWVVPVNDPPGSRFGEAWVEPLWFVRAFLWFALVSPALLWLFRRWPRRTFAMMLVLLALTASGVLSSGLNHNNILLTMGIFGCCWLIGFAYQSGRLRSVPWARLAPVGLLLIGSAYAYARLRQDDAGATSFDDIPVASGLFNLGFTMLLLRARPAGLWLCRHRLVDAAVMFTYRHALTIYVWMALAVWSAAAMAARVPLLETGRADRWETDALVLSVSCALLIVAATSFGWAASLTPRRPHRATRATRAPRPAGPQGPGGQPSSPRPGDANDRRLRRA